MATDDPGPAANENAPTAATEAADDAERVTDPDNTDNDLADEVPEGNDPWARYVPPDKAPPEWLGEWGPRTWMNARARLAGQPSLGAEEWGYYTDALVTGFPRDELDPYRIFDVMSVGGDESHLRIMCRSENHLGVFDREIDWTRPDDSTWLGMDTGEEYAALLSLATGRRIRSGGLTRMFRADDEDPRGHPEWFQHRSRNAPTATRVSDALLPHAGDNVDMQGAVELLLLYPQLRGKHAVDLVRAARQYQLGIWVAEEDPELAWLRFVSAAETMAMTSKPKIKISHAQRLQEYHPALYNAVEPAGRDVLEATASAIAGHLGATHKFVRFLADRIPPPPAERPEPELQIDWSSETIADLLKVVYDHRSRALHAGTPIPAPLLGRQRLSSIAPAERFDAPMGMGNSNWTVAELPMTLHAFEHLVRNALQERWRELAGAG